MIYGRQLLHSFLVTSMYTHTYIVSFYQQKDIFVFVGETYAHSNPLLILVNLCEVSSIHFITMMDHHWGGSWGGVSIYIYIWYPPPPKDLPVLVFYWYLRGFTASSRIPPKFDF